MSEKLLYIHVVPIDALSANSIQVLSMCQAFAELGADLCLAFPQGDVPRSEDEYKEIIENKMGVYPRFSVVSFKQRTIFGKLKMLASYFPAKALMAEVKPDLVFLRNVVLVNAAITNNIPFIYESHNSLMHETSSLLNTLWTRYIIRASRSHLMRKFVTISGALGKFWEGQGIPPEKILAIHDGFDDTKFQTQLSIQAARAALNLPQAGTTVLYVGSLFKERGIEDIIYLASQTPDVQFRVVGGPDEAKENYALLACSTGVSNIEFIGSVEHKLVPTYLFSADVLLMTWSQAVKTIDYCSPLKLFEYMAAGRIIVGHGFPTIREVLCHGEDAYLADPTSRRDLLEKLHEALAERNTVFGDRARKKAFDEYSWMRRARLILDSSKLNYSRDAT